MRQCLLQLVSIDEAVFGPTTVKSVVSPIQRSLATGTNEVSSLIYHGDKLVGACLAGVDSNAVNGFAGIGELAVLPDYQGQGLGSFMLKTALNNAHPHAPAMKLVVTIGNPAESLYHRLGFLPGPRFTEMKFPHPIARR
jgi:GNAT superfamily N-acetyltransferase